MRRLLLGAAVVAVVGALAAGWRLLRPDHDIEEPSYEVRASHQGFEIRAYAPTIEARVTLPGTRQAATQAGFRVLAGYIFGGNRTRDSIAMTAPVSATPTSTSIAMTAPVSASPTDEGWTVSFTMPARWTMDTLPIPDDDRIELVEVPAHEVAVRTFSGRATASRVDRERQALERALDDAGFIGDGVVTVAQFNPPWIPGPWRRNELQLPVRPR